MNKLILSLLTLSSLATAQTIDLGSVQNGDVIAVKGNEFTVRAHLSVTPTDYRKWDLECCPFLTLIKEEFFPPNPGMIGSAGIQEWTFRTRKAGNAHICFVRYDNSDTSKRPVAIEEKTVFIDAQDIPLTMIEDANTTVQAIVGQPFMLDLKRFATRMFPIWEVECDSLVQRTYNEPTEETIRDCSFNSWTFTVNQPGSYVITFKPKRKIEQARSMKVEVQVDVASC